ncbi:MAG: sigma-70 family RNA polymerase sigma factor [Bacteroidota bacterium]
MNNPEKIFDALLVKECQSASTKALTLLVKRWHGKLCKQAYWYTKDAAVAKDIVQDSWSVILKRLNTLKDPYSFGSWATRIVVRKSIDWLRKQKTERNQLKSYHESTTISRMDVDDVTPHDQHTLLRKAIMDLSEEQQLVLHMFYLHEQSLQEISALLGIPKGTVKSRLFTAREKLKQLLKNRNYEK